MTVTPAPSDDDLRGFLLGTLPPGQSDAVETWLEADPVHAARLDRLPARDVLTDAVTDRTPDEPVPPEFVERVVRRVSAGTGAGASEVGNAGHPAADGGTAAARPERLGHYRIVREIGHGGMGTVYEAEDEKLARRVAVKVLHPRVALKPGGADRFLREARAAAAVEHENVVPILHVGDEGGVSYLVMPLLKGESLDRRLKREGTLPFAEVERVGRDVAAGLAKAHASGLVHRDLKPANLWLDAGTGRARILDFGLARLAAGGDALTADGALVGTPAYLSPEQLDGHPAGPRSDLFALGATLYECATGTRAFDGPSVTAILRAVADHHPRPPAELNPAIPARLSALIQRLLAKNPDDRPADAEAVRAALAGEQTDPGRPAAPPVPRRSSQYRRGVWLAVATAGLLVAATVGVKLALDQRTPAPEQPAPTPTTQPVPTRFRGKLDVLVERTGHDGKPRLLRLNEPGALPMREADKFRIEGEVDRPAYLYLVWVDPGRNITPVYPWDPRRGRGWGSRPDTEQPADRVSLPGNAGDRYTALDAKPGVATMVMFARTAPLDVPDDTVRAWFETLPDLPLPPGGDGAAVWFDDFAEVQDPLRRRTFGVVGSDDEFARWQGQLQKSLGSHAGFQTAVSFARTGTK